MNNNNFNNNNHTKYTINFDKFFELVTKKTQNEKNNDSTVTEIWQPNENGDLTMVNKEMIDAKGDMNNNMCTMRYEFYSGLLNGILAPYDNIEGNLFKSEKDFSFGQRLIMESFKKEGIIIEENKD